MATSPQDINALPVSVAKGLIAGFVEVLGSSGTHALLNWMVRERYPAFTDALPEPHQLAQFNPLFPYYRDLFGAPLAVPYLYLALLRQGLDVFYPQNVPQLAHAIGIHWWMGEPPIQQNRSQKDTLNYLMTNTLLDQLYTARQDFISQIRPSLSGKLSVSPSPDERWLLTRATHAFAYTFQTTTGIAATVTNNSQTVDIRFSNCPFCNNRLPHCNVLPGVFQAFLLWLYRTPTQVTLASVIGGYQLKELIQHDNSHHISFRSTPIST